MEGCNGLLSGGDEIFLTDRLVPLHLAAQIQNSLLDKSIFHMGEIHRPALAHHLVELVVKLGELGHLLHHLLLHEEGGVKGGVALLVELLNSME